MTAADQGRDEPAFGAESKAKRGVLDIAPADHGTVLAEPGRADVQPRIRRVGAGRRRVCGPSQEVPIGNPPGPSGGRGLVDLALLATLLIAGHDYAAQGWRPRCNDP